MRKFLLTTTALVMMGAWAASARAADVAEPPPEVFDWSGLYIGAHVGYGEADYKGCIECSDSEDILDAGKLDLNGVVGGVHGGYNHQFDSFVLGIEGDLTWTGFEDEGDAPCAGSCSSTQEDGDHQVGEVDLLASVRGRLGFAFDRVLIFGTGGVAFTEAEWETHQHGNTDKAKFNDTGWVAGGGVEWAASENISIRAEGLYYFFGDKESVTSFHSATGEDDDVEFDDALVVRVGATWHLW